MTASGRDARTLPAEVARLATVTVTFGPDPDLLARQLSALPADCTPIVVDNGSAADPLQQVTELVAARGGRVIANGRNLGLATASNLGLAHALELGCSHALLLDQDSVPLPGAVAALAAAYASLQRAGAAPGCIGPRLRDDRNGLEHGFHCLRGWRWSRRMPPYEGAGPIRCASINGSGTYMEVARFAELGGLDESLFIDHVDSEWSFRVAAHGFHLYGIPDAVFEHRMGERSLRFWFLAWRAWPYRSPERHRYLFRNACLLARRAYVPRVWKAWMVAKLAATAVVHALFDARRREQLRAMGAGMREGLRAGRTAPATRPHRAGDAA